MPPSPLGCGHCTAMKGAYAQASAEVLLEGTGRLGAVDATQARELAGKYVLLCLGTHFSIIFFFSFIILALLWELISLHYVFHFLSQIHRWQQSRNFILSGESFLKSFFFLNRSSFNRRHS